MNQQQFTMIFGLVAAFGWAAFLLAFVRLRAKRKEKILEMIHRERIAAIEKGVPLPELPEYFDPPRASWMIRLLDLLARNPKWPLGVGAFCISTGIGACVAMRLSGDEYHNQVWSFGLIGVFGGVGLILNYFLLRNSARRDSPRNFDRLPPPDLFRAGSVFDATHSTKEPQ